MNKLKTAVTSAAILTSAALVLPALAQTYDTGTSTAAAETDGTDVMDETSTTATGTDVGAETAEDDGTGTGTTIPSELPDTGGGWGASQR